MKTKILIHITLILIFGWLIACGRTAQPKTTEPTVPAEEAKKRSVIPNVGESLGFVYQPGGRGWNYKDVSLNQADFQKWYNQNKNLFMEVINNLPPDLVLEIVGHTDESGPREAQPELGKKGNLWYSQQRAQRVYDALIRAGIPRDKIRAVGVAEDELIPGIDPYDQRHRRVTFRINKK